MAAPQPLSPADYVTAPRLSAPAAVALGIALLSAVPEPTPESVLLATGRLREAVVELQLQWGRKVAAGLQLPTVPRDVDLRVDRAFRAVSMRLEAIALLHPDAGPEVELAQAARARLFPDGLRFLTRPFAQQWAHGQQLIELLDDDAALAGEVESLVGATTLGELRTAQQAYGEVLGITEPKQRPESVSLVQPLDDVRTAIIGYALQIVAMQDVDHERIADARSALAPIDALRARQARRAGGSNGEGPADEAENEDGAVTPETLVPTVGGESS